MDEPLSNLDAKLRVETRANIAQLQARLGTTTLYVTHDQVEAMTMGHRVALLKDGKLQQVDTPRNLYDRPGNAFVAGFIGSPAMNLRVVDIVPGGAQLGNIVLPLQPRGHPGGQRCRPQADQPRRASGVVPRRGQGDPNEKGDAQGLKIEVKLVEELGADAYVYGELPGDNADSRPYVVRFDGRVPPRIGDVLSIDVRTGEEHAFHPETGERLG